MLNAKRDSSAGCEVSEPGHLRDWTTLNEVGHLGGSEHLAESANSQSDFAARGDRGLAVSAMLCP
jgi:hypothetical protein